MFFILIVKSQPVPINTFLDWGKIIKQTKITNPYDVSELAIRLGKTNHINEIYSVVHDHLSSNMDLDGFIVSFYNKETNLITAQYGQVGDIVFDVNLFPPIQYKEDKPGTQNQVIKTGKQQYFPDYQRAISGAINVYEVEYDGRVVDKPYDQERSDIVRSAILSPMFYNNELVGIMQVQSYRYDAYSNKDFVHMEALASLTSVSINNLMLKKDLESALKKSEDANLAKTSFLANISHEIRTPVNIILGYLNIFLEKTGNSLSNDDLNHFNIIMENANYLVEMINDIVYLSRAETGEATNLPQEANLIEFLDKVIGNVKKLAEAKGLVFKYSNNTYNPLVFVDQKNISRAIEHILTNAIKFTKKGEVSVSIDKVAEKVVLTISDTGIGMSSNFLNKVDKLFVQESFGFSRSHEGMGIGLTLAKLYCDQNEVDLRIESTKDIGTKVMMVFGEYYATPSKDPFLKIEKLDTLSNVLYVENNINNLNLVSLQLKDRYNVLSATTVNEAIDVLRKNPISLALIDLKLDRGFEGLEVARFIKTTVTLKQIPVIALTGYKILPDEVSNSKTKLDDVIFKPIGKKELIAKIDTWLGKT